MVMDVVRSCSRQKIAFVAGGSGPLVDAEWYFAAKTAKPFPIPHVFGSPNWDATHPTLTELGFQAQTPARWVRGNRRNTSDGTTWAGPIEYFVSGAPGLFSLPRGVNGTPVECIRRPAGLAFGGSALMLRQVKGGLLLGGQVVPDVPAWTCLLCADATPATVTVVGSGFTVSGFNASFVLQKSPTPCIWEIPALGGFVRAQRHHLDGWIVEFDDGAGGYAHYSSLFDANCLGTKMVSQTSSTMSGSATIPVTGNP